MSIGWGNHASSKGGLFFDAELGMMFTGKPSVTLAESTGLISAADIAAEAAKVKKDAIDFFPILKFGVGYTF